MILETNHITTNNGVLLLAAAGGGIVLYSLFLLLTVFLPKKKEERIRRRYNAAFLLEHSEFERYQTLIREYIPDECYVFFGDRKKIRITVIHETCYIIVYANAVFETHNLRNVPVVFETYRELNREVLSDFLNCGTM